MLAYAIKGKRTDIDKRGSYSNARITFYLLGEIAGYRCPKYPLVWAIVGIVFELSNSKVSRLQSKIVIIGPLVDTLFMNTSLLTIACIAVLTSVSASTVYANDANDPIPNFYQEPGLSRTRQYTNQHANERIDPFTGKLQWHYIDLFIPGNGGLDLKVQRSYTSQAEGFPAPSPTGIGWTIHFGRVLRTTANNTSICDTSTEANKNPVLEMPDGSRQILYVGFDSMSFVTTNFWKATCLLDGSGGGLAVYSPDGTRYDMNVHGLQEGDPTRPVNTFYVSKITDRNGNTMSFTYDYVASNLFGVKTVSTSDGRSVTFNYAADGSLQTITDGSRTWTYIYEPSTTMMNRFFLKEVRRPDGRAWKYDYHLSPLGTPGSSSLSRVTYPSGGTIDYVYDFVNFASNVNIPRSTVLKQKTAAPGGTWNWTYTPASLPLTQNAQGGFSYSIPPAEGEAERLDRTTVAGPDESKTYYHVGYNSAYPGITYLIGSLLGSTSPLQNEAFSSTAILISNQVNKRPGDTLISDATTSAPLITYHSIGRAGESFSTSYSNFDEFGNPTTISETGSHTKTTNVTYHNDPAKWIIRQKKNETITSGSETLAITRTFDANANMLTESRAGVTTTFTYTPEGDIASRTDARNKTTTYSNYFRGIARTEVQPEDVTIARTVSIAGNVTSVTDGELATTAFTYDDINRITGITHPLGNPVTVAWDANTRTVTRGAYLQVTTYDGFGREVSVRHTDTARAESVVQNYRVDSLGRRVFASYPNATIGTGFSYDMLNRVTYVFNQYNPDTSDWTTYRRKDYFSYQIGMVDERTNQHLYGYRSFGDPSKTELILIDPPQDPSPTTTISRTIDGQIASVTQDGVTRTYHYDSRYFLISVDEPETGTTVMGRDEIGNMVTRQVGTSGLTTYSYDGRNRLTAITYPVGTPNVTKTYYKDDKPKSIDNGVARLDYIYDANKNLASETLTVGTKAFLTKYAYDGNDALSTLTYGSNKVVDYAPDAFGRARQATPYVAAVSYHPTGQPSSMTYANGVQTNIGLNLRQWPATLQVSKNGNLFNTTYSYDDVGNVTGISDTVDSAYNRSMNYDGLDRLTGISGPWGSGSIGYDLRGNITHQTFGGFNLAYTYDSATHRLTSVSGSKAYAMNYDVYGNVSANGTTTFAYNDASAMRCAKCGQPDEILYDYDGANQRVRVRKGSVDTYFVYGHDGQLLWEETPDTTLKEYIYLGGKQVATREQRLQ